MKSSDIKIGTGYVHYGRIVKPYDWKYYEGAACVPLSNKQWHTSGGGSLFSGRRTPWKGTADDGRPVRETGVPCMVASRTGAVTPNTTWRLALVNPKYLGGEWEAVQEQYAQLAKKRKDDEAQRQREKDTAAAAHLRASTILRDLGALMKSVSPLAYQAPYIAFNTGEQLTWLAEFLEDYKDLLEEVKDLQYELNG